LKIGIFASELSKALSGRSLIELEGSLLRKYTSKAIDVMRRWGLRCAEFGVLDLEQLREIAKVTAEEGNMDFLLHEIGKYSAANLSYANREDAKEILEGLKETIEYASKGGFRVLTIHPALYNPRKPRYAYSHVAEKYLGPDEAWVVSVKGIRELARYAERMGVILGLENMPFSLYEDGEVLEAPHFGRTKREFMDFLLNVEMNNLRMTYDVGHANTICQPADYVKGIVNLIAHIHIHDNDGRYDQHAPLGVGTVNFQLLFKILDSEGYCNSIVVERAIDENIMEDLDKVRYYISKVQNSRIEIDF